MVAYVLGITDIDPLQFGLIFERFLNPDRVSPPDIDVDFCEARRGEVLEYVRQKYGERRVAQIITFGKLKAKSVVRDVGRVMGLSYRDADRIAKMIPNELNITLDSAVEKNPELKRAVATEPPTRQLFDYAKMLEGLSRNAGVHAAGVVIADRDLSDYIPLCRDVKGNDVISQYPMGPLNDLGLLKMDFLGLKTLTVIEDTLALIHKREPNFSLKNIPLDDPAAFALYNRGETIGLFQMESGGMTSLSKQFDVKKLDDIIALIALYRPGPMELIPEYVKAKKGITPIKYLHPLLEEYLRRYVWRDDLSGTGNGRGEQTCRLFTRTSRSSPARHGQERQGEDGEREKKFHRRLRPHKQNSGEKSQRHFRFAGKIRGLRI